MPKTALAYNRSHREHFSTGHVERPKRLDAVMTRLEKNPVWHRLRRIEAEPAEIDDLILVHSEDHIRQVREAAAAGERLDSDTYTTPQSFHIALDAVGCVLAVTDAVTSGRAGTGFAVVRPPGHHATPTHSMGFCLFSNAAIAARWAQRYAGIERVLIVDFDVHHGNGTQDAFFEDSSVMFMSTHQSPFYPGTGLVHERGHGPGYGTTFNVPLPSGTGDDAILHVYREILRPHALSFDPELIVLSAGFDAHWMDLLGGMRLSTTGYAAIVREVKSWARACCDGRIVSVLEGGYHEEALADCAAAAVTVLHDDEADILDLFGRPPGADLDVSSYLLEVAAHFEPPLSPTIQPRESERPTGGTE